MITLKYKTEDGLVEAAFANLDELEAFRNSLREKALAKRKEALDAEEKRLKDIKKTEDDIRERFSDALVKAYDGGLPANAVARIMREALTELSEKYDAKDDAADTDTDVEDTVSYAD